MEPLSRLGAVAGRHFQRLQAFQLARFQAWAGLQLDLLQTTTDAQDPAALAELGSKYREMTLKFNTKSLSIHERLSCLWNELHSDVQALFEAPRDHHEAPLDTAQAVKRIEQAA